MTFIKNLWATIRMFVFSPIFTFSYGVSVPLFYLLIKKYHRAGRSLQIWGKGTFTIIGHPIEIEGEENIDRDPNKRYLVIANHGSMLDIPALATLFGQPITWVLKEELMNVPWMNVLFKAGVGIPIERSNARDSQQKMTESIKRLKSTINPNIIIYPEGTRSKTGEVQSFKRGFVKLVKEFELDVLPVTLSGFYNFFSVNSKLANSESATFKVTVHKPISIAEIMEADEKEFTRRMHALIKENYYP